MFFNSDILVFQLPQTDDMVEDLDQGGAKQWARPEPGKLDSKTDKLVFQQIEIDHYIGQPMTGMPGASSGPVPVMRLFGTNKKVFF